MAGGDAGRLRGRAGGVRRGGGVRFDGTGRFHGRFHGRSGRLLLDSQIGRRIRRTNARRPSPAGSPGSRRHRGRVHSVAPRRERSGEGRVAVPAAAGHRRARVGALDRAVRGDAEGAAPPRALRPDRTPATRRLRVRARAERVPPRPTRPRAFSRHGQGVGARYVLGAVDGIGGAAEDGGRRGHADAAGGAGGAVPGGRPTRSSASSAPGARAPVRPRLRSEARAAADVRRRRRGGRDARRRRPDEHTRQHAREVGEVGSASIRDDARGCEFSESRRRARGGYGSRVDGGGEGRGRPGYARVPPHVPARAV
mmetsp:Transcript_1598/g.6596  ORF Transcript_1598/g.6596 Transcript_1598/m.6596 type:complete len:311 (+) Transcript_1598:493-1425(+)